VPRRRRGNTPLAPTATVARFDFSLAATAAKPDPAAIKERLLVRCGTGAVLLLAAVLEEAEDTSWSPACPETVLAQAGFTVEDISATPGRTSSRDACDSLS